MDDLRGTPRLRCVIENQLATGIRIALHLVAPTSRTQSLESKVAPKEAKVSRFSCTKFPGVFGVFDCPGLTRDSR
jgi:hypothetical protein